MKPTLLYDITYPLWPFQLLPQNNMTLNGHFMLKYVFAQVRLEFLRGFFENSCIKSNKGRPTLSVAEVFSMVSGFW